MQPPLSELEHVVMNFVWSRGPSTAEDIRTGLAERKDLNSSTVRTILRRLEEKGYLRRRLEGRAYVYAGLHAPGKIAAGAVRGIIDRFCGGSVEALLTGLVDGEVLDAGELKALAEKIAAKKRSRAKE